MTARWRKPLAVCGTCSLLAVLLASLPEPGVPRPALRVLAAEGGQRWYRGNLHTHTLWSDGDDYPEMVALWYKDHGYDFLSFSDHNTLLDKEQWISQTENKGGQLAFDKLAARFPDNWVETRTNPAGQPEVRLKKFSEIAGKIDDPGRFLLIQGEEISDQFNNLPIHMNATNVAETIAPMKGDSFLDVMQRNTDALLEQRRRTGQAMVIHLNHPNFHFAITAEDLARVRGENLFEVYNGHPQVYNDGNELHASAERIWDVILTLRISVLDQPLMFGLATDDCHSYHTIPSRNSEPGRGWIQVLAPELTPDALVRAIEQGSFYASSGVQLARYAVFEDGVEVEVREEPDTNYTIDFIGTRKGYDRQSEPVKDLADAPVRTTARYSNDVGRIMKTVTGPRGRYTFDPADLYIRARITSSRKHPNPSVPGEYQRAWCQPVRGPAGRQPQ